MCRRLADDRSTPVRELNVRAPDFGPVVTGTPAPCRAGCPVGTDASAYVALIDEGRVAEAYDVARQHNPFTSVCGRVCSAPCERACRRGVIDVAVSIRALKRVLCDVHGAEQGPASRWMRAVGNLPAATRGSVGIIGAGPAGLAATHDLRASGFSVTIYESLPMAGGMMRYGIPAFRLPRHVLDAEIGAIASLGVDLRLGCAIGRDVQFSALLAAHDAVLVTVGCQQGRTMRVPGVELPGVIRAVDYLRTAPTDHDEAARGAMVVIGGGSVAFDAARSAWRARTTTTYDGQTVIDVVRSAIRVGQDSVTMIAPEQRAQLSVPVEELHEAVEEGVTLRDGFGVVRILGDTRVTGVEIAPVVSLFDAEQRFNPTLDLSRASTIDATTVVLAIGQQSDTDFLAEVTTIARTPWGGIAVDATLRSTDPRVWAAGDVATGPRDLIDAIAAGQRAAASIIRVRAELERDAQAGYVAPGVSTAPPMRSATRFWSRYEQQARAPLPVIPPQARDATAEVEHSFTHSTARLEASRCLRCDEHMQFSATRCIGCALCVDVCPQSSLALLPSDGGRLAMVFDDDTCIRCGLCVHRCPTDALHFTLAPALHAPALPPALTPPESLHAHT